jgi:hypothetical protein
MNAVRHAMEMMRYLWDYSEVWHGIDVDTVE